MRKAALIAGVAIVVAGCGSDSGSSESSDAASDSSTASSANTAASSPTVEPGREKNDGADQVPECGTTKRKPNTEKPPAQHIPMELCDAAVLEDGKGGELEFTVEAIKTDLPCTAKDAEAAPKNGHIVTAFVSAKTSPQFDATILPTGLNGPPSGAGWSILNAEGATEPDISSNASERCFPIDWPSLTPDKTYRFRVAFDVPSDSGALVFVPTTLPSAQLQSPSWQWNF
ncbi:hypothetical protein JGU71_22430 [Antrihabitans sp. YC3-6]|uniref:Uncharacterized protein n=1 Tax=Antrihabitans stalagmiti TaxID=2799499 RepID=A0A934NUW9_9NOCA|nr:hypothetical protein [Antrihabitans stalagmiti]MBJ8341647.1 hypothetical protein [Antrihabitans stalagmiti]